MENNAIVKNLPNRVNEVRIKAWNEFRLFKIEIKQHQGNLRKHVLGNKNGSHIWKDFHNFLDLSLPPQESEIMKPNEAVTKIIVFDKTYDLSLIY